MNQPFTNKSQKVLKNMENVIMILNIRLNAKKKFVNKKNAMKRKKKNKSIKAVYIRKRKMKQNAITKPKKYAIRIKFIGQNVMIKNVKIRPAKIKNAMIKSVTKKNVMLKSSIKEGKQINNATRKKFIKENVRKSNAKRKNVKKTTVMIKYVTKKSVTKQNMKSIRPVNINHPNINAKSRSLVSINVQTISRNIKYANTSHVTINMRKRQQAAEK